MGFLRGDLYFKPSLPVPETILSSLTPTLQKVHSQVQVLAGFAHQVACLCSRSLLGAVGLWGPALVGTRSPSRPAPGCVVFHTGRHSLSRPPGGTDPSGDLPIGRHPRRVGSRTGALCWGSALHGSCRLKSWSLLPFGLQGAKLTIGQQALVSSHLLPKESEKKGH